MSREFTLLMPLPESKIIQGFVKSAENRTGRVFMHFFILNFNQ